MYSHFSRFSSKCGNPDEVWSKDCTYFRDSCYLTIKLARDEENNDEIDISVMKTRIQAKGESNCQT